MSELVGMKELHAKIEKLKKMTSTKELKKAANKALTPAVRAIRIAAPVGTIVHKTYKGRFVLPGFLRKSVTKSVRIVNGAVNARILVKGEAFYGKFQNKGGWFYRAWATKKAETLSTFERLVRESIKKATK